MADLKLDPFATVEEEDKEEEKVNPFENITPTVEEVKTEVKSNPFEAISVPNDEYIENNREEANKLRITAYQKLLDRDPSELTTAELPPPNLQMYEGLDTEEAMKLYKIYNDNENTRFGLLGSALKTEDKTYTIPLPKQTLFSDDYGDVDADGNPVIEKGAKVGAGDKLTLGVGNAFKWLAVTGAAGIDYLANQLSKKIGAPDLVNDETGELQWDYITGEEFTKKLEEDPNYGSLSSVLDRNLAEVNPGDSIGDTLLTEGAGLVVGGAGAFKLADKLIKYVPKLPKIIQGLTKFTSVEAGMAAALSPEVGTVFLGDNSLFNTEGTFLEGVDVNPDDPQYQQILDKKMNILMDGLLIAKPAEGIIKSAVWVGKGTYNLVIDPFVKLGSRSSREKEVVKQILDQLTIAANPQKYGIDEATAKKRLVEIIKENQEVIIKMTDDEEITLGLDTMTALERGLAENADDERIAAIIANARKQKSGALSTGEAGNLEVVTGRPASVLEDITSQTDEVLANEKMLDSADTIVSQGQFEIKTKKDLVEELQVRIDEANGDVLKVLGDNPVFKDLIGKIDGIDFNSLKNLSSERLIKVLEDSYGSMTNKKNTLYSAVKGGEIDNDSLFDILSEINPGQLDAGANSLNANSPLASLMRAVKQIKGDEFVDGINVTAKERLDNLVATENLDFGKLYNMRGDLAVLKNDFFLSKNPEQIAAARIFNKFVKFIDEDALDFVAKGGGEAAENANLAKNYYKDEYAPIWNDGALDDYTNVYQQNYKYNQANYMQGVSDILEDTITNKNKYRASHLINSLNDMSDPSQASLVTDYIIGDVVSKLNIKLKSGVSLDKISLDEIVSSLGQYSDIVVRNFPEEAGRINQFIDNIRSQRGNIEGLNTSIEVARKNAEQAEIQIYTKELSEFFDRSGRPVAPENVFQAFNRIFSDQVNGGNTLDDILERAGDDPVVLDGIKVAYQKHLRKEIFGANIETGGNRAIKTGNAEATVEGLKPSLEYGRKIFKDTPEIIDAYETLIELSYGIQRSKGAKSIVSDSSTVYRQKALGATDRLVTMVFGVLDRVGARIRTGVGGVIRSLDTEIAQITDEMLSNPEEFIRIANKVTREQLPTDVQDILWSYMVRVGIYNEDNEKERSEFIRALAEVELEIDQKLIDLEEQTDQILRNEK